ncbi:hypothetical protein S83_005716 [Arachis hypogaea]
MKMKWESATVTLVMINMVNIMDNADSSLQKLDLPFLFRQLNLWLNRGMAFGWLSLTGNIGSILGGPLAVILASTSFAGIPPCCPYQCHSRDNPREVSSTIYAVDKFFEAILASIAPPIVDIMAQRNRGNAAALAKALYTAIACCIYSILYWTYPRDREQAGMIAQMESELQPLESIDLHDNDEQVLLPRYFNTHV